MPSLELVIISGLSGAGKTHALKCFEDAGYFCVDNLPPALLPVFAELCSQQGEELKKVALGIDLRERAFFSDLAGNLERVRALGYSVELLFFEARDEILVRRFSESRRPHPILPQFPVLEGVKYEREQLVELRRRSDRIIDTSDLTVHELKSLLAREYLKQEHKQKIRITVLTFGFKFGVPYDIDLLFDVRFLRNPHFVPDLKPLTGEDPRVRSYVLDETDGVKFLDHLEGFLSFLIPLFERERRSYLSIAIGCTGGRHRSVAVASKLREHLATLGYEVGLAHRDIHKPS